MSESWRAIPKGYLAKLSEAQRDFILTAGGRKFYHEFIFRRGNHLFVVGNTGSGKSQKGYWLVNWLKHSENIIWISTGKSDEILPLLTLGKRVRIIIPKGSDFRIDGMDEETESRVSIVQVDTPGEAWHAVDRGGWDSSRHKSYDVINIFEFRNTISSDGGIRSQWMADLFYTLAEWTREGTMPNIFPCSIFVDESQWVLAGTRITTDMHRVKTSEIVTENALEIRSAGGRLVFFAQDYKNITPASRENMLCAILCRGASIERAENASLASWCNPNGAKSTSTFRPKEGRFVFDDGIATVYPWVFPYFPLEETDRTRIQKMRVKYGRKFINSQEIEEIQYPQPFPELGKLSAVTVPEKRQDDQGCYSRYYIPSLGGE